MSGSVVELKEQLKGKSCRVTKQREIILDILADNEGRHFTAEDIFSEAKKINPRIGIATVYRTLELFTTHGIVRKLDFGVGPSHYEFAPSRDHHHLICLNCGRIYEVKDVLCFELEKSISYNHDFEITASSLRFFGYCSNCR